MLRRLSAAMLAAALSFVSQGAIADSTVAGHGVVYFAYDLGTYSSEVPVSATNNWYVPGREFKNPVALYNLNPSLVDSQLAHMRASGMDYIVLQYNLSDLTGCKADGSCNDGFPQDWLWGYIVDESLGQPRPQHMANLQALLTKIRDHGFRDVVLRFTESTAAGTETWNEVAYSHAWNYIVNVHTMADQILGGSATTAIYDLGGEAPGTPCGSNAPHCQMTNYLKRLWSDYSYVYGVDDTIGFSTIATTDRVNAAIDVYGPKRPSRYAFTAYGNVQAGLNDAVNALPVSERTKPIMVMETYQNDPTTVGQIQAFLNARASAGAPVNLFAVTQWPLTRAEPCAGCDNNVKDSSVAALSTDTQLSAVMPIVSRFAQESVHPELLRFTDVNCAATTGSTCTVQATATFAPDTRQAYQIYVTVQGTPRKLWSCMSATANLQAGWMARNLPYRFEYYKTATCTEDPTSRRPDAVSTVYLR